MQGAVDIEIYVRDCSLAEIRTWLQSVFGPLSDFVESGAGLTCQSSSVGFIITPGIDVGLYTSIWFSAVGTPWRTHLDCARQAARQIGVTVRCDPGLEYAEVHPYSDVLLEITSGTERLVVVD